MKKIVYSLILSSLVGSNVAAFSLKDSASKSLDYVKDHKVAFGLGAAGVVTAGFISYDLLKNDAKVLRKAGLLTANSYAKVKELAKKHPVMAVTLLALVATGTGIGVDLCVNGKDNSYTKAGYDKVAGLFSSSEKAAE
jgi:hypothetical protein